MAHNIGQMFYFGERPWHKIGEELKAPATLEQALAAGGLDWEVALLPIVPAGEPESRISHRVAVVRTVKKPGATGPSESRPRQESTMPTHADHRETPSAYGRTAP